MLYMFILLNNKVIDYIINVTKTCSEIKSECINNNYPKNIKVQKTIKRKQIDDELYTMLIDSGIMKFNKQARLYFKKGV